MLTDLQAERLLLIVNEAKLRNWDIPTGRELAQKFYNTAEPNAHDIRAANRVVKRLAKYVRIRGENPRRLIPGLLATEPTSASYLIAFRDICMASASHAVSRGEFHRLLKKSNVACSSAADDVLDALYDHAEKGGYLTKPEDTNPGLLRIGKALNDQLPYLQLLAASRGESERKVL